MANYCENVLRVVGDYADIAEFDRKFGNDGVGYHFDNLYPTPKLSVSDTCDWRKAHWGVKNNFYEDSLSKDYLIPGTMETCYYFDTPNTGPELLIQHVSAEFKDLEFLLVFSEPTNDIGGIRKYYGGELVSCEVLSDEDREYWFANDEAETA